ncbi:MAG: ABC transporter permease [Oscillospiraceae bacterium]|nr:ABC transporter permease [Oscillospiraceae bacterium]
MSKRFQNVFRAFVRKELTETLHSMFWILLFSVIVSNVLQYVTMQAVSDLNLPPQETALQFGSIMMYMSVIIIMFVGHTLINRYIYEERTTKTIHVMLSGGMSKTAIWCAKLAVAFLLCMILLLLSVALNFAVAYVRYGLIVKFTAMSAVMTFVTMPFLCFGILSLISVAYWYFKNMNLFGMIFPIVAYLGVWNLSIQLVGIKIPEYIVLISVLLGIGCFAAAAVCVRLIPKERIAGGTQ